jgi:hypothetical protein
MDLKHRPAEECFSRPAQQARFLLGRARGSNVPLRLAPFGCGLVAEAQRIRHA